MIEKQFKFIVMMILSLCFGIQDIMKQDKINSPEIEYEIDITVEPWRQCDLEWEEMPMPEYFTNVNQTYYNNTTKGDVAAVVMDYVLEAEYTKQQKAYDTKIYLDEIVAQLDRENGTKIGIERYFKIEKKELEEILEKTDCADRLEAEFPDASYWGDLLPVGDKIWVQYDTGRPQNTLPAGLVIENPLVSLGYKDARAGMYLFDIQKMYPDSQVEEARSEWRDIRYLRYKDDAFVYYYVAISEYGDAAILYITPAMVSDTVQGKEPQEEQAPDNPEITEQTQYVVSGEYGEQLKEQEKQLCDRKEELQLLQLKNNLMELVEKKGNEDEDSYIIYEKYFRMKQGEMLRIENSDDLSVCGMWGHLNSHFGGVTFGTVEDILIQYGNDSMSEPREYELPRALIIFNKNENRGPMEALAGLNFAQIQEALHETEIQDGFMYFEDGTVYYIQYEDACYAYTFVSDYEDGRESWLIIDKKM